MFTVILFTIAIQVEAFDASYGDSQGRSDGSWQQLGRDGVKQEPIDASYEQSRFGSVK